MRAKLTDEQVAEIRERGARGERSAALAREFGVDGSSVARILSGATYRIAPGPTRPAGTPRTREQIAVATADGRERIRALTDDEAREIRELIAGGVGVCEIARVWGIDRRTVSRIASGRNYSSAGGPTRPPRPSRKLTDRQVYEIRVWAADGATDTEIGREFGISAAMAGRIRRGIEHRSLPGPTETRSAPVATPVPVVWEIRRRLGAGERYRAISAATGVSLTTVYDIATGRTHYRTPSEALPAPGQ